MTNARLAIYTAAPGQCASFIATRRGRQAVILPLSLGAESWLRINANVEAIWDGDELVVEMRDFLNLADAIYHAGFLFDRSAFPN